ncbi:MAG: hypothetical protein SFU27_07980 [Thermonemataceae bacterium]|nr:hypothetical protein [Thermonemataceae bacterium]
MPNKKVDIPDSIQFDYDKIEPKTFVIKVDEYITEYLFFEKAWVIRKHEEYFNDWSVRISVKDFWQQQEWLSPIFAKHSTEIFEMLKKAIRS